MKRYLVFGGYCYDAAGGWQDLRHMTDSKREAEDALAYLTSGGNQWGHLVDTENINEDDCRPLSDDWWKQTKEEL